MEGLLPEYHDTGATEPETSKATYAQTVLEIFTGKKVIELTFRGMGTNSQEIISDGQEIITYIQEMSTDIQEMDTYIQEMDTYIQEMDAYIQEMSTDIQDAYIQEMDTDIQEMSTDIQERECKWTLPTLTFRLHPIILSSNES